MAGHLLQLRRAALRGASRRESGERGDRRRMLLACLAGVAFASVMWWLGAESDLGLFPALAGLVVGIGALLGGVSFARLDPVTPARLALVGVPAGRAASSSLALGFAGLPFLATLVGAAGFAAAAWLAGARGLALGAAIVGALLAVVSTVLLAKLGTLLGDALEGHRSSGDWGSGVGLAIALACSPALFLAVLLPLQPTSPLADALRAIVEWSPLGAPLAACASAAGGDLARAGLQLGLGAVTALALWLCWTAAARRQHARAMASPIRRGRIRLGLFSAFAGTPAGAIAARASLSWLRDPRYRVLLVTIVIIPILVVVPLALVGVAPDVLALIPLPVLAFLMGWMIHNDVAFDGSAVWLHVTSGMSGRSDRLGRAAPALIGGAIALVLGTLVTGLLTLDWLAALSDLGIAASLLGAGVGISSIVSATSPYPVARPGDSPFTQPVRSWGAAAAVNPLAAAAAILLAAPAVACTVIARVSGAAAWHLIALGVGLAIGVVAVVAGIVIGGRAFERRSSEIIAFASHL